jgi:hypothetical protein
MAEARGRFKLAVSAVLDFALADALASNGIKTAKLISSESQAPSSPLRERQFVAVPAKIAIPACQGVHDPCYSSHLDLPFWLKKALY